MEPLYRAAILVVDDQGAISRLVVRYLAHLGYTVLEAGSGEEALAIVRERRPPIDLVLSDVAMPGMTGTELASEVLAECPGPQVILMTGEASEASERVCVRGRIIRLLHKPLDLDQLEDLLRATLECYVPSEEWQPPQRVAALA